RSMKGRSPLGLKRRVDLAAEDADFAGSLAHVREGAVEPSDIASLDIDEKLILPGPAVNGATLNLQQIDAVFGQRFEGSKERAGTVGEAHGEGGFAGLGGDPRCGVFFGKEKNEAGEIFGVVLEVLSKNHAMVIHCRAAPGDGGARFISAREHFADAAGSVF